MKRRESAAKLHRWFQDDSDKVFWITGKPGSGKSVLMKLIRDHDETNALLQEWAGEHRLITADLAPRHAFKKLDRRPSQGSITHRSATLRHRLRISQSCLLKKRWALQTSHGPWSLRELKQMMSNLSKLAGAHSFFLVDGLDKCCPQHAHDQLMKLLSSLMQLPHCKYLVSSRPWHEFTTRLDGVPTLCIAALTRFDMLIYATEKLNEATLGQGLSGRHKPR